MPSDTGSPSQKNSYLEVQKQTVQNTWQIKRGSIEEENPVTYQSTELQNQMQFL